MKVSIDSLIKVCTRRPMQRRINFQQVSFITEIFQIIQVKALLQTIVKHKEKKIKKFLICISLSLIFLMTLWHTHFSLPISAIQNLTKFVVIRVERFNRCAIVKRFNRIHFTSLNIRHYFSHRVKRYN